MSRTYRNYIRRPNCVGSNTEYYRDKRRRFRRIAKQRLQIKGEDFVNPEDVEQFKDTWREPTDGAGLMDRQDFNNRVLEINFKRSDYQQWSIEWLKFCKRKWMSKLKNKHKKYKNGNKHMEYILTKTSETGYSIKPKQESKFGPRVLVHWDYDEIKETLKGMEVGETKTLRI